MKINDDLKPLFKDCSSLLDIKERCFKILNDQPDFLKVRVLLAKIFYEQELYEFSLRELREINSKGEFPLVKRILKALGSAPNDQKSNAVVAEVKLD